MTRQTRISAAADRVIEACWLLAIVFAPYFFNLLTARHFEPDKATSIRSIALVALAAWAIKTIERATMLGEKPNWRAWWRAPLAIPALVYAGVFLLTTITSIQPGVSWWGSYNRLQGTYTNLSYMAFFAVIVGNLRSRAQLDRLVTTAILTAFSVAIYGLAQHYGYDPLPWKGGVLTRISSTMGNSIFVSAYLIMIVPFILTRLATSIASARQRQQDGAARDWVWGMALLLLIVGSQVLLLGVIKFGAAVRTTDFRYWWVSPIALVIVTAAWAMVSRSNTYVPSRRLTVLTGSLLLLWSLWLVLLYNLSSGVQETDPNPLAADWGIWIALGVLATGSVVVMSLLLPRRAAVDTSAFALLEIAGYAVALVTVLLAIFFSQSRGPQIGLMAGLAVFVNLVLFRLERNAVALGSPRVRLLRSLIGAAIAVEVAAAAFLLAFNVSDAPFFERLRQTPYVGRLGRLLETEGGTGRVRTLIWAGDERGGGAIGLILSNPLRTVIGYGPETMFTAYNPFYPPELAGLEARGASPDRSHQAQLDELVTRGILGLLSYFFLLFSAIWLAWRFARGARSFPMQALFIGCLAAIVAHLFEGLTGIPVVSTLTMLWVTFGVIVAGGVIDEQVALGAAPATVMAEGAPPPAEAKPSTSGRAGRGGRQGSNARGRGGRPASAPSSVTTLPAGGSFRWIYGAIALVALLGVWFWNIKVVRADMWYNQASAFTPRTTEEELYRFSRILNAIDDAPREDYYHLQLGNSPIQLAYAHKARNVQSEADVVPPREDQSFSDLFVGNTTEARASSIWRNNSVEQLLEYARLVLERAYALNPGNKDHAANLGRLHALWYNIEEDRTKLDTALRWYQRAHEVAPNDVVILNEWATNLAQMGETSYADVEAKLKLAQDLDPRYAESYVRLGNLYRIQGKHQEAAEQYARAIERRPNALDDGREGSLEPALQAMKADPAALRRLRDAYEQALARQPDNAQVQSAFGRVAAALGDPEAVREAFDRVLAEEPDNVRYREQYTVALSDTQQYDAALQQAQAGLKLAQDQQRDQDVEALSDLVETLQQRVAGRS